MLFLMLKSSKYSSPKIHCIAKNLKILKII
jgi:hypothetical protein